MISVFGTASFHLSNTFVASLYCALAGICSFTFSLSHAVPVNTSMYLYLFPYIVLPSPASKVTLTRPSCTVPGFAESGTTTFSASLYSAVNVFVSTFPVVGTASLHLSNTFVLSLYVALFGNSFVTSALFHAVPVNTSITLYLFPAIVFPSPASKVTLV